ncbi:MAG: low molecular weight phosphotyrosine protein phosphatase [Clostridia bacterium]|nr:low molecular weight phosphotyrosine protein phosphatase [Clostridia bacterium]MBR0088843.1 low molecular weight phosphotyrosine protein phosphatase [Clostridia bacterium]
MTKILFVCHGNICRSAMAEFVMKDIVRRDGREAEFEIASAATSTEEIANPVYPPVRRLLAEHGLSCSGKTARQITREDYDYYDLIICMDHNNLRNLRYIIPSDPKGKIRLLLPRDVADPWYTRDFEATWDDVTEGCEDLYRELIK